MPNKNAETAKKVGDEESSGFKMRRIDYIFGLAGLALLSIIGPYLYYTAQIYQFIHENAKSQAGPDFTQMPELADLWISVLSGLFIYFSQIAFKEYMTPLVFKFAKRVNNESEDMVLFKAKKSTVQLHLTLWHLFAAVGLWYVIRGKPWTPWFMGGDGDFVNGFVNMPFSPLDTDGYYFGLILLGHPLQESISHFFIKEKEPEFYEMALHHLAHLSLASCYMYSNVIPVGSLIAFVHDASDVPGCLCKFFHLSGYDVPWAAVALMTTQVLWFYGRLLCLPMLMKELYRLNYGPGREHLQPFYTVSQVFIGSLFLLHIYWFFLFQKIIYRLVIGKKVKDLSNDVTKMKKGIKEH